MPHIEFAMERERILIVDDEDSVRWVLKRSLEKAGMETLLAKSGAEALEMIGEEGVAAALIDIRMPGMSGLELLHALQAAGNKVPVIIMTAQGTMQNAVEAIRRGAFDYLTKPFDLEEVNILIGKALHFRALALEAGALRTEVQAKYDGGLIGNTTAMKEVYKTIGRVAETTATVLIHGESGTGKELVARAIHFHSTRAGRPFIAVNSAAIPGELLESELFGHEKGSFSGAVNRKIGKFETAAGGTVFLDEIGDLAHSLQGKLLRVLQEQTFERVGGTDQIKTDVRVITATHRNLEKAVQDKRFRQDLYYRLNVVQINIPPLRARKEDLPLLVDHFLHKYVDGSGRPKSMTPEALGILQSYEWPGNVRELENAIQRAVTLSRENRIFPGSLPPQIGGEKNGGTLSFETLLEAKISDLIDRMGGLEKADIYDMVMQRVERQLLTLVLTRTKGNQEQAARLLGINRNTVRKMIRSLKIKRIYAQHMTDRDEASEN